MKKNKLTENMIKILLQVYLSNENHAYYELAYLNPKHATVKGLTSRNLIKKDGRFYVDSRELGYYYQLTDQGNDFINNMLKLATKIEIENE